MESAHLLKAIAAVVCDLGAATVTNERESSTVFISQCPLLLRPR